VPPRATPLGRKEFLQITRALRRHGGKIPPTERELGIREGGLYWKLRKPEHWEHVRAIRREYNNVKRRRTIQMLIAHKGSIAASARALGIKPTSLNGRIKRYDLRPLVEKLRPRKLSAGKERRLLLDSLQRNHGQMWKVQRELGISKSTLFSRIQKYDLFSEAETLRLEASKKGPRRYLPKGYLHNERREKLRTILESCSWVVKSAAVREGVSLARAYNMMHELGLMAELRTQQKSKAQQRMHRLIDALRLSDGVLTDAARTLGVSVVTVSRWCVEFEIDRRECRKK
jgi:transcriptional regulator of acetoin/glycerol metabolism